MGSRIRGSTLEADLLFTGGRPMTRRKKQVNVLRGTAVVGDEASEERFAEDNVGKIQVAAGAGSNLQGLHDRGLG